MATLGLPFQLQAEAAELSSIEAESPYDLHSLAQLAKIHDDFPLHSALISKRWCIGTMAVTSKTATLEAKSSHASSTVTAFSYTSSPTTGVRWPAGPRSARSPSAC